MQGIHWMPDREWGLASPRCWRGRLSATLLAAGGQLIRWAWHLAPLMRRGAVEAEAMLEFCADADGVGRLYRNGQLEGTLTGVQRL